MASRGTTSIALRRRFAPGTAIRNAIDLIDRQRTGALVLFGDPVELEPVCAGGFYLTGAKFTAQRLAELAKMDGGIVMNPSGTEILRANVHFLPDATIATNETGTRFRTAEQLAISTGCPVLSVSEEGRSLAVVFTAAGRYELATPADLFASANQTLNSTARVRSRFVEATDRLTRLEVDDVVTVHDAVLPILRATLITRLSAQLDDLVIDLGGEGRLIAIQVADLNDGVAEVAELVYADYAKRRRPTRKTVFERLVGIPTEELYDTALVASELGLEALETPVRPRGVRLLHGVPRLPETVKEALIAHFRDFQAILHASVEDLAKVEGVGTARARQLRTYLGRLHEVAPIGP